METLLQDIKHSIRMFLENPGFTITAVAALTLGIGANTAIFSIVNTVLLKPVPFPEPDRMVMLMNTFQPPNGPPGQGPGASPAKFAHWRSQSSVLEQVTAFTSSVMNYTGGDVAEQMRSQRVSADYFRLFQVPIAKGRSIAPEEDIPNGPKVAMLSYNAWANRFGSDPQMLGRSISLDGNPYTVVGVVGKDFDVREFGPAPDVWIPFQLDPNTSDHGNYFLVAGRLKPGVTLAHAKEALAASSQPFKERFPMALGPNAGFTVVPLGEAFVANVKTSLFVLLGAVSFVLLIACTNVANLLLVRATGRRREIAIRSAIGAGRGRLIRQLLTESVMLSFAGGVLGLILGYVGIRALLAVNTAGLPRVGQDGAMVAMDWRVVVFTLALSLLTGLVFGLIPALGSSRMDLNEVLKEAGGRSGTGFRTNKTRSVLVTVEISLAVILLVGSALLIKSFVALGSVEPGFNVDRVLTISMSMTGDRFYTAAGLSETSRNALERVRGLPGVQSAAATCCVPLQGGFGLPFNVIGRPVEGPSPFTGGAGFISTTPGYFDVFNIPIKRGRGFTDRDDAHAPGVMLINEAMAKQFWKDADPLNDRIALARNAMKEFKGDPDRQIIGIVTDVRDRGLNNDPAPTMYIPQAQVTDAATALNVRIAPMTWVVRTQGAPTAMLPQLKEVLRQSTGLPIGDARPMSEIVSISTGRQRLNMLLMTAFGAVAVLLAAIGIYGLMAYSVEQRTTEIGIRLALGAEVQQVRKMIVFQGMGLALIGVVVGLSSAFGLTRFLSTFLFGVKGHDPMVFVLVPVLLSLTALAAAWIPAARASRVDPLAALRYE